MYTNLVNGKIYIGQTCKTLEERADKNGSNYRGSKYFYRAIQKYGWDNFRPTILKDGLTQEEANYWEIYYIKEYDSTNPNIGYNITPGGSCGVVAEETRKIISEKAKERYKDKTQNPNYGKHWSEEFKQKMRERFKGENGYWYGTHMSEAQKRHLSELFKGTHKTIRKKPYTKEELERMQKQMKENSKLWSRRVRCIEDNLEFETLTEAANYYNRSICCISDVLHGRQKTCAGKTFEYAD